MYSSTLHGPSNSFNIFQYAVYGDLRMTEFHYARDTSEQYVPEIF